MATLHVRMMMHHSDCYVLIVGWWWILVPFSSLTYHLCAVVVRNRCRCVSLDHVFKHAKNCILKVSVDCSSS